MSRSSSPAAPAPLVRFAVLAGAFYLLWFFGYEHYLAADGRLDVALSHNLASVSAAGLRLLGYAVTASADARPLLTLQGQPAVIVGHECNGLVLYALFGGFVLAFPGPWRRKLWFVPLGLFLIYALNVLRIMALCLNNYYSHQTVDFNHHYTFTAIVYASIFGLWMWWATRLATRPAPTTAVYAA
ncbi:MAG TPA: archaeosortase/exosortase family protein [Hymenobacter sp.]|uniref:exosortase X n=1 Tax=Hymenobacter sp. TaxID=1898978 RepID=UPI002D7FC8E3|nr:archaeosortase/exosortase family protein [Hymenobacter sp.]HET9502958.1 archaeosortase/exosortase family protein [Hymenobacter sp.]